MKIRLRDLLQQIWKEEEMPKEWRRSIIVTLYKRGNARKITEGYRCCVQRIRSMRKS